MDVRLPNGRVIQGVPEGTPKDVIMQKAITSGIATAEDFGVTQPAKPEVAPPQEAAPTPVAQPIAEQQPVAAPQITGASPRARRSQQLRQEREAREQTRAVQELPELPDSGLLAQEDPATVAAVTPVLLTTTDPNEIANVLQANFPDIGIQYDEAGNIIAANNRTGATAMLNRPGLSGMDVLQFLGAGAAFTPAGRAGTVAKAVGAAGLTEAGIQASQALAGGQFDTEDVALAAGLGGAAKALESAASTGYRAARGQVPEEQAALIRAGEQAEVPVMTSDIIEPQTFVGKQARTIAERVPVVGTGAGRAAQQEARQEAVDVFVEKFESPSYVDIVDSLRTKSKGIKQAAGNILQDTGRKLDDVGEIPVDESIRNIDSALRELERPGVLTSEAAKNELRTLRSMLEQPQTFSTLKENRTFFRDIVDSFGKGDRTQLPTKAKSLLGRASEGMSKDMDSFAKKNLTAKEYSSWKKANRVYAGEAEKLKNSRIKNVLDKGDVTPENVDTLLFSKKPSEVKTLYNSLTTEGKNNARSALIYRALENSQKRAAGMSPNTFVNELNKLSKQTDVFFKGKDKQQLEGFKKLMNATKRAQDASAETATGQQLFGIGAGMAAISDITATLGAGATIGGLSKLYNSPTVRDALIRLHSVPPRSDRFLQALFEAESALVTTAQSLRAQSEE